MKATEAQLKSLVALCWKAASKAPMEHVPEGMFQSGPQGGVEYNSARWETYRILLTNLAPNYMVSEMTGQMEQTMVHPKERWEE